MKHITVRQTMLCLTLVVCFFFAQAQVVSCYFPSDYTVDAGSAFTADVKVDSFINVGGCGFSVNWDPTVLKYTGVNNIALEFNELSGINENNAVSHGELGFSWVNSSAFEGKTLPDSTVLFSITFEVIGIGGDTTSLRFTDTPVPREFATLDPAPIPSAFIGALVTVMGTSDTYYNNAPDKISLFPPTPNPFYENTIVKIDLRQAALTTIKIIDQLGKVLFEDRRYFSAGMQNILIAKEIFKQSGTYYCLLHADEFRVLQKLLFIDRK